jgi:hypothetical protein
MSMRRLQSPRLRAEDGSMVLALLAVIMVGGIVAVVTAATVRTHRVSAHDRGYTTSIHAANAGVEEALFRLNERTPTSPRIPESGADCRWLDGVACVQGTLGDATYEWFARQIGDGREWEVHSAAEREGRRRRLVVSVWEERLFFASAFATLNANFGNQNTANTYSSGINGAPPYWPRPGRLGLVGSNGNIDMGGNSTIVDGIQIWNLAPGVDPVGTRCTGQGEIGLETVSATPGMTTRRVCSQDAMRFPPNDTPYLQRFAQRRVMRPPAEELAEQAQACGPGPHPSVRVDADGVFVTRNGTTVQESPTPVLRVNRQSGPARVAPVGIPGQDSFQPGYRCFSNVNIRVNTTVDGTGEDPVVLYVTGRVSVENRVTVNCTHCAESWQTPPAAGQPPVAAALRIYLVGTGAEFQQGNRARFGGTIYGPQATCGNPGSAAAAIYGSMICNTISNVGQWSFHYDAALEPIGNSAFHATRWRER